MLTLIANVAQPHQPLPDRRQLSYQTNRNDDSKIWVFIIYVITINTMKIVKIERPYNTD